MELRTGCDLVQVVDVEHARRRYGSRYLRRVFTDTEQTECAGPDDTRRLAARFAAKEAVVITAGEVLEKTVILGIGVPLTGKNFLITYDGTVKAGIRDITNVDVDVDDSARTITVDIPDTEVLDSSINPDSIEQYDQSFNPLNQLEVKDTAEFLSSEESKAEKTAVDSGVLDRSESRSQELFTQHVKALAEGSTLEDYKIEVK